MSAAASNVPLPSTSTSTSSSTSSTTSANERSEAGVGRPRSNSLLRAAKNAIVSPRLHSHHYSQQSAVATVSAPTSALTPTSPLTSPRVDAKKAVSPRHESRDNLSSQAVNNASSSSSRSSSRKNRERAQLDETASAAVSHSDMLRRDTEEDIHAKLKQYEDERRELATLLRTNDSLHEAVKALRRKHKAAKAELQERNCRIAVLEATIRQQTERLSEYQRSSSSQPVPHDLWVRERAELTVEITRLQDTIHRLRHENNELSPATAASSSSPPLSSSSSSQSSPPPQQHVEMAALRAQNDVLRERVVKAEAEATSARERLAQANMLLDDMRASNAQLRDALAQLQARSQAELCAQTEALRAEIERQKAHIDEIMKECAELQETLDGQTEHTRITAEQKQRMEEEISSLRLRLQAVNSERDRLCVLVNRVYEVESNIDAFIRFSSMATVAASAALASQQQQQEQSLVLAFKQLVSIPLMRDNDFLTLPLPSVSSSRPASMTAPSSLPYHHHQQQQQQQRQSSSSSRPHGSSSSSSSSKILRRASSSSVSTLGLPLSSAMTSTSVDHRHYHNHNNSNNNNHNHSQDHRSRQQPLQQRQHTVADNRYPSGGVLLSRFIGYYSDDNVELLVRTAQQQAARMLDDNAVKLSLRQRCYVVECLTFVDLLLHAEHDFHVTIRHADRASFYSRMAAELDTTVSQLLNTLCRSIFREEIQQRAVETLVGQVDQFGSANKHIGASDAAGGDNNNNNNDGDGDDDDLGHGPGLMLPVQCDALLEQLRHLHERLLTYSMPRFLVAQIMAQLSTLIDCGCFNAFLLRPQGYYSFERGMHLQMNIGPVEDYLCTLIEPILVDDSGTSSANGIRRGTASTTCRSSGASPLRSSRGSVHTTAATTATAVTTTTTATRPSSVTSTPTAVAAGRRLLPHCTDLARLLLCDKKQVVVDNNYRDICPSLTPAQIHHVLCNYTVNVELQEEGISMDDLRTLSQLVHASASSTAMASSLAVSRINSGSCIGSRIGGRTQALTLNLSRLRTVPSSSSSSSSSTSSSSLSSSPSSSDDNESGTSSDSDNGEPYSRHRQHHHHHHHHCRHRRHHRRHHRHHHDRPQHLKRYSSNDTGAVITDDVALVSAEAAASLFKEQSSAKVFPTDDYHFSLSRAYTIDLELFHTFIAPLEWLDWFKANIVEGLAAASTNGQSATTASTSTSTAPATSARSRSNAFNGAAPTAANMTPSRSASMSEVNHYVLHLAAQRRSLEEYQRQTHTQYGVN